MARKRSQASRNASTVAPWVKAQANALIQLQWSPEQIARKLRISHETLYQHIFADKALGGCLWTNLRCHKKGESAMPVGVIAGGKFPIAGP
jgi:transposase, IS30 family